MCKAKKAKVSVGGCSWTQKVMTGSGPQQCQGWRHGGGFGQERSRGPWFWSLDWSWGRLEGASQVELCWLHCCPICLHLTRTRRFYCHGHRRMTTQVAVGCIGGTPSRESHVLLQQDIWSTMFLEALSIIASNLKYPNYLNSRMDQEMVVYL